VTINQGRKKAAGKYTLIENSFQFQIAQLANVVVRMQAGSLDLSL
jgi:hypothetical protein